MSKNRRSVLHSNETSKNIFVDKDVIPWVVLVIVAFLVMFFIIKYSGATAAAKQILH